MFKNLFLKIIIGIVWIMGGYGMYRSGWDPKYGFPVPKIAGIPIIILGFYCIVSAIKNRYKTEIDNFLICPNCNLPIRKSSQEAEHCASCGKRLEELNGFYERHPELTNKMKT